MQRGPSLKCKGLRLPFWQLRMNLDEQSNYKSWGQDGLSRGHFPSC